MSSVTEAITVALGKQGGMLFGARACRFAHSFAWVLLLSFGLKAERVGERSLGMYCHRDGAGVPGVSGCGSKGIAGLFRWEHQ